MEDEGYGSLAVAVNGVGSKCGVHRLAIRLL